MNRDCKAESDESEDGGSVFDDVEIRAPQEEPCEEGDRKSPPWNPHAGRDANGECDSADFGDENEKNYERDSGEYDAEETEAESVAKAFDDSVLTDRRKAT